jgi:hypothetical protein
LRAKEAKRDSFPAVAAARCAVGSALLLLPLSCAISLDGIQRIAFACYNWHKSSLECVQWESNPRIHVGSMASYHCIMDAIRADGGNRTHILRFTKALLNRLSFAGLLRRVTREGVEPSATSF